MFYRSTIKSDKEKSLIQGLDVNANVISPNLKFNSFVSDHNA